MATKWLDRSLIYLPMCFALFTDEASYLREINDKWWNAPVDKALPFPKGAHSAHVTFLKRSDGSIPAALVCIRKADRSPAQTYSILAHEAVHIWQEMRRSMGEESPSDEFEAYSVQGIARALFDAYDAQMKVKRARR